jgi:hypothetical protein
MKAGSSPFLLKTVLCLFLYFIFFVSVFLSMSSRRQSGRGARGLTEGQDSSH